MDLKDQVQELQGKLQQFEEQRGQLVGTLRGLREKVGGIEKHYGSEIVVKLHQLRNDICAKVDGNQSITLSMSQSINEDWPSIEAIIGEISAKVNSLIRQRENLQKAVNQIQSEKQQIMINYGALQQASLTSSIGS